MASAFSDAPLYEPQHEPKPGRIGGAITVRLRLLLLVRKMTVEDALERLALLGCSDDPILFQGDNIMLNEIVLPGTEEASLPHANPDDDAEAVQLSYWTSESEPVKGSLHDMFLERLRSRYV